MYQKTKHSNIITSADVVFPFLCCGVVDILVDIHIEHIQIGTIKR